MKVLITILLSLIISFNSYSQKDSTNRKSTKYRFLIAPISLIGLGVYSRENVFLGRTEIRNFRNNHFNSFHNELDDYLQFAPIGFAYGIGILPNMKSKNDFINKSVLLLKSELLMAGMVYPLKEVMNDKRPDTGAANSWPSGHTAQAFVAASFLDHEYRHKSIWISVAAYSCASSVAVFRVLNDRHWSSDVLAGAGIGILATEIAYLTHQYKWKNFKFMNKKEISFLPYYQNRVGGLILSAHL